MTHELVLPLAAVAVGCIGLFMLTVMFITRERPEERNRRR